jgi:hypothetical protein
LASSELLVLALVEIDVVVVASLAILQYLIILVIDIDEIVDWSSKVSVSAYTASVSLLLLLDPLGQPLFSSTIADTSNGLFPSTGNYKFCMVNIEP